MQKEIENDLRKNLNIKKSSEVSNTFVSKFCNYIYKYIFFIYFHLFYKNLIL